MGEPVFVNKDAEWLHHAATSLMRGEYPEDLFALGMRLADIARKHQDLDTKYLNVVSGQTPYEAGMKEMALRIFERSNLPPEERTMPVVAQKLGVGITKFPAGKTAAQLKSDEESNKRRQAKRAKELGELATMPISISPTLLAKIRGTG